MVPDEGAKSNAFDPPINPINHNKPANSKALVQPHSEEEIEQIFETLADWNRYIEKHVPKLKGPRL